MIPTYMPEVTLAMSISGVCFVYSKNHGINYDYK